MIFWNKKELPQIAQYCWSSDKNEPFSCDVISSDGAEFVATIRFGSVHWTQKSVHPQSAVDGAARKAGAWCKSFTEQFRWLVGEHEKPRPRGAPHGTYTMAKVPDSPEQEEWIRRKRAGKSG